MILVIDANMVIAALIKDSKAREIIVDGSFKFIAPDFIKDEINKYSSHIKEKAHLTDKEFELLLALLFDGITIIPKEEYNPQITKAKKIIEEDIKDAPYIACYISLKCDGIWTNDPHYDGKSEIQVIKTAYLLDLMGNSSQAI